LEETSSKFKEKYQNKIKNRYSGRPALRSSPKPKASVSEEGGHYLNSCNINDLQGLSFMQHLLGYIAGIGVFGHFWTFMGAIWAPRNLSCPEALRKRLDSTSHNE
jgi:hypothetical protein